MIKVFHVNVQWNDKIQGDAYVFLNNRARTSPTVSRAHLHSSLLSKLPDSSMVYDGKRRNQRGISQILKDRGGLP